MEAGRIVVIVLAVVAVGVAAVVALGGGGGGGSGGDGAGDDDLVVTFASSPEKEALLAPLVRQFNEDDVEVDGRPVRVDVSFVASGEATDRIARGRLQPVAWSPSSSLWGRLLDFDADRAYVGDEERPSLVRTPLVIAMWEPLARALGWPRRPVGWQQVLRLATAKDGWASVGKPEFGRFKLGHTNPDFSTSGLSAVTAQYFSVLDRREGLSVADVARPQVRAAVRRIQRSIVHYGDTTLFFAEQMARYGPAYASAVAMEETTLRDFDRRLRRGGTRLVGIEPAEGTFVSDNPYVVLDAPWVDAAERRAADRFAAFLRERISVEAAARAGFRPGDPQADRDPPRRVLATPQPAVLAKVREQWRADRKPANVMLVVDVSGSMGEEARLERAKEGLRAFFRQISPRDRVGLTVFDDQVRPLVDVQAFGANERRLREAVAGLLPGGETAWIDATADGVQRIRALADTTRIDAVVMLTDGEDTSSGRTVDQLERTLREQAPGPENEDPVRVFTIAYGDDVGAQQLDRIAAASGGKGFRGDPAEIERVYAQISSFF